MLTDEIFDHRVNRLIALGRAALAAVSLLAVWLDPAHSDPRVYALLAGYTVYAFMLAAVQWSGRVGWAGWGIVSHVFDLLIFVTLLYLTDGPTSPFFPLLVFGLLAGTLRWQWRGAMWTTLLLLGLYVAMGLGAYPSMLGGPMELQRFLIRSTHLAVVGGILTFFGFYQERISGDLLRIHTATFERDGGEVAPVAAVVRYVGTVYQAERAFFAWSDPEEPWLFVAKWNRGELEQGVVPPDRYDPLVAEPLSRRPFVYRRGRDALYRGADGRMATYAGPTVHQGFVDRYGIAQAIVLPVAAQGIEGWLFVLKSQVHPYDAIGIAAQLDTRIAAAFDRAAALAATSKATQSEQRLRLARDLHDGVLQFLAGLAMQLESIVNAADDPDRRRNRLRELQDALATEQRELRTFIRRLRPGSSTPPDGDLALEPDLAALVDRLENQWRANIHLKVHPPGLLVPAALHYDLHQLVREAVANAVRHGKARWINVTANREDQLLHLTVGDDGCGLGVHGTFEAPQLVELGIGPRSLRERIQTLGGTIIVTSASLGTLVCMSVPLKSQGGRGA